MISFANKFQTDGVGTSFLFARKTDEDEDAIRETQLGFSDFTVQEVENSFEVVGVDPGRSQVFTASYGCGNDSHQVRRCSSKEYYAMTGSPRRNAKLQKEKVRNGISEIESECPTCKTANEVQFHLYLDWLNIHYDRLVKFYGPSGALRKFQD